MQSIVANSFNVTTLLGSHLGLTSLLPVDFASNHECTLNNHLNIQANTVPSYTPKLRYFGVGIKGCYNADDDILVSAYNPSRANMNLFTPIPIRCVPVDEDLTDSERALYRLRQRKTLADGNEYFLYWLKCLTIDSEIKFKRINPLTGAEEAYELDSSNLTPTPEKPSTDSTVTSSTSSIIAYGTASLEITADEILEYINVAFDGDTRYARISELGLFTGDDKTVTGTTGQDVSISYTEAVYTMLHSHLTWTGSPLTDSGSKFTSTLDITTSGIYQAS